MVSLITRVFRRTELSYFPVSWLVFCCWPLFLNNMFSVKLQLLACTILSSYLMQSYILHNNGYFDSFFDTYFRTLSTCNWKVLSQINQNIQFDSQIICLWRWLISKIFFIKCTAIFPIFHTEYFVLHGSSICWCFNTAQLPGQKWNFSILMLPQTVVFYIMIFRTASGANTQPRLYGDAKTHSDTENQKKCGKLNKLKSQHFSIKRQVAWFSLCLEYD